ncbi:unnamed protein product [Aphanomyces euteiches]
MVRRIFCVRSVARLCARSDFTGIFNLSMNLPQRLPSSTNEPKQKKKRVADLLERSPALANAEYIGGIQEQIFFDTIASWTFGLLDLRQLLTLSMVSRSFYYTMGHSYWEKIVQAPMFAPLYRGASFAMLKPRQRAIYILTKCTCQHCRQPQPYEIKQPKGDPQVCQKCILLPEFAQIDSEDVFSSYGLSTYYLHKIPCQRRIINGRYRSRYKLKDVLELVEQERRISDEYFADVCALQRESPW